MLTILRFFVIYKPLRFFFMMSAMPLMISIFFIGRFGALYFMGRGDGNVQSLILAGALLVFGFLLMAIGIIGDVVAINRRLLEDLRYHTRLKSALRQKR